MCQTIKITFHLYVPDSMKIRCDRPEKGQMQASPFATIIVVVALSIISQKSMQIIPNLLFFTVNGMEMEGWPGSAKKNNSLKKKGFTVL